ncbi:MAG: hypothetical protein AAGB34_04320 [Planctomycetota bacterium]
MKTAEGVCADLGLPVAWLKRESKEGKIPYVTIGSTKFYDSGVVRETVRGMAGASEPAEERCEECVA